MKTRIKILIDKINLLFNTTELERKDLLLTFDNNFEKPLKLTEKIVNSLYKKMKDDSQDEAWRTLFN